MMAFFSLAKLVTLKFPIKASETGDRPSGDCEDRSMERAFGSDLHNSYSKIIPYTFANIRAKTELKLLRRLKK